MKYELVYSPKAVREFRKLPTALQDEAFVALKALQNKDNHQKLKVHKLNGKLKDFYAASINYSHRIVFYFRKNEIAVTSIGPHDIYEKL